MSVKCMLLIEYKFLFNFPFRARCQPLLLMLIIPRIRSVFAHHAPGLQPLLYTLQFYCTTSGNKRFSTLTPAEPGPNEPQNPSLAAILPRWLQLQTVV